MVGKVEDIVKNRRALVTVAAAATAAEVANKMSANDVGCVLITDQQDRLVGIISERDMLNKVAATNLNPAFVPVSSIMNTNVITCDMHSPITIAEQLMAQHKIRHLPIVENNVPVAMLSSRDVIAYQLESNKAMKLAAEQIARLSMNLKSLNFDEVVELIISEVPHLFEAQKAVLWFEEKASSDVLGRLIYRKDCSCSEKVLLTRKEPEHIYDEYSTGLGDICSQCHQFSGKSPGLLIRLAVSDLSEERDGENTIRQVFLCMCCLSQHIVESEQMILYKVSLLREILAANLTNARLQENYLKARRESMHDPLTGLSSRRALEQKLEKEFARAVRYNLSFCIAIIDIDDLKRINDSSGHFAGDRALLQLARVIRHQARTTAVVARYGGDEFVVLMPETTLSDAAAALERLRVRAETITVNNSAKLTISCGLAGWSLEHDNGLKEVFRRADAALYEAKRAGRNRVIIGADSVPAG